MNNHSNNPDRSAPRIAGPLALVGGGRMGQALVGGLVRSGQVDAAGVHVVEPQAAVTRWWQEHHPRCRVDDQLTEAVSAAATVIIAVKPDTVAEVAAGAAGRWTRRLVISVAAGVPLQTLVDALGTPRVVRVMPNTPCLIGHGASAYASADGVTAEDRHQVEAILGAVSLVCEVAEKQLDAVTGLSGSGPAYVCLVLEALADGGVAAGLPRELATRLATQTVLGTAAMVQQTGKHPAELKDAVASPGGTTIAGLRALENNGLRAAMIEAVLAAAARSGQLG